MSRSSAPSFSELLADTRRSAVHLEMRDVYAVGDEATEFEEFKRTGAIELDPTARWWPEWLGTVRQAVGRGVTMRRARIVSEPVTDYIRWEHAATPLNLEAGELVRWLPRRQAVDIALPGADFGCSTTVWCSSTSSPVTATGPVHRRNSARTPL